VAVTFNRKTEDEAVAAGDLVETERLGVGA